MCAMVNVILDAKNQSFKLCSVDGIDVVSYCPVLKFKFIKKTKECLSYNRRLISFISSIVFKLEGTLKNAFLRVIVPSFSN